MTRLLHPIVALLVLPACPTRENEVKLLFNDEPIGFACAGGDGGLPGKYMLLMEQFCNKGRFSLVFDFLDFRNASADAKRCRVVSLFKECRDKGCCPVGAARKCVDVTLIASDDKCDTAQGIGKILNRVRAEISLNAPDGYVAVRAVGTLDNCTTIRNRPVSEQFPADSVLGCANSCPVELDTVDGDLLLELDLLSALDPDGGVCSSPQAIACANVGLAHCVDTPDGGP